MTCPRCQHENPATVKFCGECGARLDVACAACRAPNPASNKFCHECGAAMAARSIGAPLASPESYTPKHVAEKILTSKAALEGERKQVTVLFADLKGSMELLADRDPEEARKLLDPVLDLMMEAVHGYEGTVNQVMGDGIMALFGAPLAHEDHTVRACYAALRMQESVKRYAEATRRSHGVEVQIRVGLHSGEVVVRSVGSDLRMDYSAIGQTTHLAARMEQLATPGTIRLTADSVRLAEGYVEVKSLGPISVKGLAEPVEIFELTGAGTARTRLQAAALRGFTRFVGRDTEIEHLRRVLADAQAGRGQVVAIVGEAGVGKSRLVHEFTHSHRVQDWLIMEGAAVSYGKATSYLPVIDLLKGYFKIGDRDDHREMRAKVVGRVLGLDRAMEALLPPLLALLDVPVEDEAWGRLDPPERRRRTLDAIRHLLVRESQAQPLLVVFEDLHWADAETQALLDGLVDSVSSARMLLLVNYRPEYQHRWGSKTAYSQLRLDSLRAEGAAELLAVLLGPDPGLASLTTMLVKRGNPFFLEETVRTMVETGALVGAPGAYRLTRPVEGFHGPATVQAILAARIDRLSPADKRLLQAASVVGKDVPFAVLRAIDELSEDHCRQGLARLQEGEFLYEARLFPDLEYSFKHALTHEVAYGGLLQERRRELHARVVEAIEALHRDRLGEQIERLAHHAVRGQLREKAVLYVRQAGGRAAARSALQDARRWFEEAIEVLEALLESPSMLEQAIDIRLQLRTVLVALGEVRLAVERLRETEVLASKLNDDSRRGRICAMRSLNHALLNELDEAVSCGMRARAIAERLEDLKLRILATSCLHWACNERGEYTRAVELALGNLAALPAAWVYEYFGDTVPAGVWDRAWLVTSLAQLGGFAAADEHEAEVIRLAEPTRYHAHAVGLAYHAAGRLHLLKGDWANARSLLDHAIGVNRTGNVALNLSTALADSTVVLAQLGEKSEALSRLREGEQSLDRLMAMGVLISSGSCYHSLGRACLLLGRFDEARRLADLALESSGSQVGTTAHVLGLLGDIATHPDRFDAESGEPQYRQALALAEPRSMRPLIAHCHLGLGKLSRRTGKHEQAREHFGTATTMYREMGMTYWLEQAEAESKALG